MLQNLSTTVALFMALTVTSMAAQNSPNTAIDAMEFSQKRKIENPLKAPKLESINTSTNKIKVEIDRKGKIESRFEGPGRTGGGNGIQSEQGDITPLEVIFAQSNKDIDPKTAYPAGYKYFQLLLQRIKVAIPSFAKDIETEFSQLKWISTTLEFNSNNCRNNTGIFRVESAGKQVVVACQNESGEVTLNFKNAKLMKKPEYMGIIFLHEAFVRKMIYTIGSSPEKYKEAEAFMITKINPYIISNEVLDPKKLYNFTYNLGYKYYVSSPDYEPYTLEVFAEAREGYLLQMERIEEIKKLEKHATELFDQYYKYAKVFGVCDVNDPRLKSDESFSAFAKQSFIAYLDLEEAQAKLRAGWSAMSSDYQNSERLRFRYAEEYMKTSRGFYSTIDVRYVETLDLQSCAEKLKIGRK